MSPPDVRVSVDATFDPSRSNPDQDTFTWSLKVAIRNHGDEPVTLRRRHWELIDAAGRVRTIDGEGVKGQQPEIKPGQTLSFETVAPLTEPHGITQGSYVMEDEDGTLFEVPVPAFSLDSPHVTPTLN